MQHGGFGDLHAQGTDILSAMPKAPAQDSDKVGIVKAVLDKPGNVTILIIVAAGALIGLEWPFHLVSKYLERDSSAKPVPNLVCTGSNCVVNGTQNIQNMTYTTPPLPNIVDLKFSDATNQSLSPAEGALAKNPGQFASFKLDANFSNAVFAVTCDRPCQATDAVFAGIREPREMHDRTDPNVTAIAVGNSAPLEPDTQIVVVVRSKDRRPIKVLSIVPYADSADTTGK